MTSENKFNGTIIRHNGDFGIVATEIVQNKENIADTAITDIIKITIPNGNFIMSVIA